MCQFQQVWPIKARREKMKKKRKKKEYKKGKEEEESSRGSENTIMFSSNVMWGKPTKQDAIRLQLDSIIR